MSVKLAIAALALLSTAAVTARAGEAPASLSHVEPAEDNLTLGGCKSSTEQVGPCSVHFSVCYGFYKRHWRYTATACADGICGSSGHTKSAKGAAEDAAKDLFSKNPPPSCAIPHVSNDASDVVLSVPSVIVLQEPEESFDPLKLGGCKSETQQVGPCSVHFSVCYGFYKRHWRYTATACASGVCGSSGHTKSAKGAAEDAAKDLFSKNPPPACMIPGAAAADKIESPPLMKALVVKKDN